MALKKLSKTQTENLRKLMVTQLDGLIFKDVYTSEEFNLKDEDRSDDVDQANAAVSNSQRLRFRNRENFYAKKLKQAIERINKKSYGLCEECDDPIGYRRLQARPTADMCITCKEDSERDESISFLGRKSKSLGNQMSLSPA